ncbi:flagellar hook-associated protein FlgK [Rhodoferax saidenbachensis]|uniref:Flagellar hook-associated protein 1 n=1 Tax=Rhodoferax saidenbachensis TaxID=1484693 RepID=A0A1P8K6D6_9BURK|nr:flagellar hook-associated protein FlgK [Rhodoferax saidenbachensis]APW41564.1 flagellar hook-associated protein FlgK [Rhodoferax saidenbachensis]
MGILSIGVQALQANQAALQTAGNNIANVNTVGYSRQRVILETVPGQFTGGGYIGKGVNIQTIQRNFDAFLTRQATLTASTAAADVTRADKLKQLEGIFGGGANGLGASISDMLNAFSDVASAPTDLTARTVVLTRIDETAARMRAASQSLDELQTGITQELSQKVDAVNSLARNIARLNQEIAKVNGNGQPPNDLLDQRDQLVRELNQYVQTTSIPADDGTVGIFIGGSQALVLGTNVSPVSLVKDEFGDTLKNKLSINRNGVSIPLDENNLGGGEISGLLRFQNTDLNEGRNLLGRLTLAVSTAMNNQNKLGLDLDGNPGGNVFTAASFGAVNILQPVPPAILNTGTSNLSLGISDVTKFVASDYEVNFTSGTAGSITRRSDGVKTAFDFGTTNPVVIDGIAITEGNLGGAAAGDRFLLKPFSTSATNIASQFSTPRALAVASPVVGLMGSTNTGSLQQVGIVARDNPPTNVPVTLTFTGPNSYTRSDVAGTFTYTPGQAIQGTEPATTPLSQWSLTLQGTPKAGDTFAVRAITDPTLSVDVKLNAGNATAMMNLRDVAMFDGAAMTDGYAGLISQIGIRTQSANYAATVSTSIAGNLEKDRAGVSGVNLDEEAAKLLQYQQAYQASAKMIQIAQNIFDTLIQGLGR